MFGCKGFVWIPDKDRKKMGEKSWTGIFVGYANRSKGYRIYDPRTGKVETSRDVTFSEMETYYPLDTVGQAFEDEGQRNTPVDVEPHSEVTDLRLQDSVASGSQGAEQLRDLEAEAETGDVEARNLRPRTVSWDLVSVPPEEEDEHAAVETGMVLRRSTRERKEPERLTASQPGELHNVYGYCSLAVGEEITKRNDQQL